MPETETPAAEAEAKRPDFTLIDDADSPEDEAAALRGHGFTEDQISQLVVSTPEPEASAATEEVTPPEPESATPPAPAEDLEELRKLAAFGKSWADAFARDPAAAISALANNPTIDAATKQRIVANLSGVVPPAEAGPVIDGKYEPQSDLEKAILPSINWVTQGQEAVTQALKARDNDLRVTYIQAKAVEQKLDALAEALGVALPAFDLQAVLKHFNTSPTSTLDDAVGTVYGAAVKAAAKIEGQKRTVRPETPKKASGGTVTPHKVKSMSEAYALAGELIGE